GEPVTVHAWTDRRIGRLGPLTLTSGQVTDARVMLDRRGGTGTLRLRVLTGDPPAPFFGALRYRAGEMTFGMRRSDDEPWVLDHVPAPLVTVAMWGDVVGPACVVAPLEPDATTDVTVVLPPATTLRGRLLGQLPRPLEGEAL